MTEQEKKYFGRTELLVGESVMEDLQRARVIIFGVGGVGSWCAEGLIRSGIKHLTIVDCDTVEESNVNRQLMATSKTVGQVKVDVLKERLLEINPDAEIVAIRTVYCAQTAGEFNLDDYDFVVDAIDSLKDKILLLLNASASRAELYCALGAALKIDPCKVKVAEYWKVRGCPLGAILRKKMKQAGTLPKKPFLCVYDEEVLPNKGVPIEPEDQIEDPNELHPSKKAQINGTSAPVTAIFGMTLAGLILQKIYDTAK